MSNVSKRRRESARPRIKALGDHKEFLNRITKSLYYGKLPSLPCLSLPVTEISAELFSEAQRGRSLKRLHVDAAAEVVRGACVSPCSLVLAILYLERLKALNPEYLARVAPSELFLVSLMVSNKFLQDDGEEDEVFCDEWAASGRLDLGSLKHLERNFLNAIDWRVYVSEQSFEAGLSWLERQVALRQANTRGFFTYADLAAAGAPGLRDLLKSFSSLCVAITLGYITSVLTVVTSTLLISHSMLPALHQYAAPSTAAVDANSNVSAPIRPIDALRPDANGTDDTELADALTNLEKSFTTQCEIDRLVCCSRWSRVCESAERQRKTDWADSVLLNTLEPEPAGSWWWRTPLGVWLYQSSLISPLHQWLGKLDPLSYIDILNYTHRALRPARSCAYSTEHGAFPEEGYKCKNHWLNLGQLSRFMVSVSDR